ncbi:MAG: SsrA-binding protein SmpB [Chlamydiae bacterium]|nr:SsrA-binding protein SmpB [Chlamydiota bacterium]
MSSQASKDLASNRKAFHDYEILEIYEAGIALWGTEIKSLREGGASLQEAYIKILKNEAFLLNAHIPPYHFGNIYNHAEKRERKLLLHGYEIRKLKKAIQEKGLTLIPLSLYLNSKGVCKVKVGVAKGKKLHDKRASIQAKEEKRSIQRELKGR